MLTLVNCTSCRTPLQLPPGGPTTIQCGRCHANIRIANTRPPPPPLPRPPHTVPRGPKKRAVICGISYMNTALELKHCINDAKRMRNLLINHFHFPHTEIRMLTDEETDRHRIPIGRNIRSALIWLVADCRAGDSLVFHYSGRGSQQRNNNSNKVDRSLWPLDYQTAGKILDDEINDTIVKTLPPEVKLHAIIDTCHSGTVLDLPFLCEMDRNGQFIWKDRHRTSDRRRGTNGGEVISFSGYVHNQTSADTSVMALSEVPSTGAMTDSFIQVIEEGKSTTYGQMLNAMRAAIHDADTGIWGFVNTLFTGGSQVGLRQAPQLTAAVPFEVYQKTFSI